MNALKNNKSSILGVRTCSIQNGNSKSDIAAGNVNVYATAQSTEDWAVQSAKIPSEDHLLHCK